MPAHRTRPQGNREPTGTMEESKERIEGLRDLRDTPKDATIHNARSDGTRDHESDNRTYYKRDDKGYDKTYDSRQGTPSDTSKKASQENRSERKARGAKHLSMCWAKVEGGKKDVP